MSKLKERIPDEAVLSQVVERESFAIEGRLRTQVGHLEAEYLKARRHFSFLMIGGALLLIVVVVILNLDARHVLSRFGNYEPQWHIGYVFVVLGFFAFLVATGIVGGKLFWRNWLIIKQFNTETNVVLVKEVLQLLGGSGVVSATIQYLPVAWFGKSVDAVATEKGLKTTKSLAASGLITNHDQLAFDDLFEFTLGNKHYTVAELEAKQWQGSGKSRRLVSIFKGYFASVPLARTLGGMTYITKDDDRHGFASLEPLTLFGNPKVKETVLEWNEFENLLHVTTTNEVEARYILTTDFMATLYDWWINHPGLIRVGFVDNQVYVLFTDDHIRLNTTIDHIDQSELRKYILTIARPLLHVIHLVEDVKV